jgi:hypothetical protein
MKNSIQQWHTKKTNFQATRKIPSQIPFPTLTYQSITPAARSSMHENFQQEKFKFAQQNGKEMAPEPQPVLEAILNEDHTEDGEAIIKEDLMEDENEDNNESDEDDEESSSSEDEVYESVEDSVTKLNQAIARKCRFDDLPVLPSRKSTRIIKTPSKTIII